MDKYNTAIFAHDKPLDDLVENSWKNQAFYKQDDFINKDDYDYYIEFYKNRYPIN